MRQNSLTITFFASMLVVSPYFFASSDFALAESAFAVGGPNAWGGLNGGSGFGFSSQEEAQTTALKSCQNAFPRTSCQVVAIFNNICFAIAADYSQATAIYEYSTNYSLATARATALSGCQNRGATQCNIMASFCDSSAAKNFSARRSQADNENSQETDRRLAEAAKAEQRARESLDRLQHAEDVAAQRARDRIKAIEDAERGRASSSMSLPSLSRPDPQKEATNEPGFPFKIPAIITGSLLSIIVAYGLNWLIQRVFLRRSKYEAEEKQLGFIENIISSATSSVLSGDVLYAINATKDITLVSLPLAAGLAISLVWSAAK